MDINSLRRDPVRIETGEWVSEIPNMGDVRLRVRGMTSPTVIAIRSRKERKVSREDRDRDGNIKPEVAIRVFGEVLLEAVLIDWDGLTENGEPVPYSKERARAWLTDRAFLPFADAVTWAANYVDRASQEQREDIGGNSDGPSGGSSSTAQPPTTKS